MYTLHVSAHEYSLCRYSLCEYSLLDLWIHALKNDSYLLF